MNLRSFDTWFTPTTFVANDDRSLTVGVPSLLFRDWINKHYSEMIADVLEELDRSDVLISFVVVGSRAADSGDSAMVRTDAVRRLIDDRFDHIDQELAAIRRDVELILAKLTPT